MKKKTLTSLVVVALLGALVCILYCCCPICRPRKNNVIDLGWQIRKKWKSIISDRCWRLV